MELSSEQLQLAEVLIARGVNRELAGSAVIWLEPAAIRRTVTWYDREREHREIGPGVLVAELRKGGARESVDALLARQADYGEETVAWLDQHFPALTPPGGRYHPAAVACVIRLHHRHGRSLDPKAHGAEIRGAVERFEREYAE